MTKLTLAAALVALGLALAPAAAQQTKDTLTVDQSGDAATLDPHLQWDGDSYSIYRNIFDNLVTRDETGRIVPQVARLGTTSTTPRSSSTSARASASRTAPS